MMTDYVAYARVSTVKQGRSGLGLEAQQAAITAFLKPDDKLLAPMYVEVESGKVADRPELARALRHAKLTGATLLVAKLDRLSRSMAFIATLQESGARFVAADMPEANELTLHIMAAVAQAERKAISDRTKAALHAARERGTKLGGYRGVSVDPSLGRAARTAKASAFRYRVREVIEDCQRDGAETLASIAARLNAAGIKTSRGGQWQATQVARILAS